MSLLLLLLLLWGEAAQGQQELPHGVPDFLDSPAMGATGSLVRTAQSGSWRSGATWQGGSAPAAGDRVLVDAGHTVTLLDRDFATPDLRVVAVNGTLLLGWDPAQAGANGPVAGTRQAPQVTELRVQTLLVYVGGTVSMGDCRSGSSGSSGSGSSGAAFVPDGVEAVLTLLDGPLDTAGAVPFDPLMWGNGLVVFGTFTACGRPLVTPWARLQQGIAAAGETTLDLVTDTVDGATSGVNGQGWAAGDAVLLPDSRHLRDFQRRNNFAGGEWEEVSVASVSGSAVTLATGTQFAHKAARDAHGNLETEPGTGYASFAPHAGNLKRNVIIRSENATGVRGHVAFIDASDVDVRYALFRDIGRTTNAALDSSTPGTGGSWTIGTNQIARYALHFHFHHGPPTTPANGFQFTVIGCVVHSCPKWGIVVHASHFGLVQDNIVYNANGAGIVTEDGTETGNLLERNFVVRVYGTGARATETNGGGGREGSGMWLRGPNNYIRDNVAANIICSGPWGFGYSFYSERVGSVLIPTAKGDTPSNYVLKDMNAAHVLEFERNEVYGAAQGGITVWWVGSFGDTPKPAVQESVFRDFKCWHTFGTCFYGYPSSRLTFSDWKVRCDKDVLANRYESPLGLHYGDYMTDQHTVWNADIQGCRIGLDLPPFVGARSANSTVRFSTFAGYYDSKLVNWNNAYGTMPWSVNGAGNLPAKVIVLDNVTMDHPSVTCGGCTSGPRNVSLNGNPLRGANMVVVDEILMLDTAYGARKQVYYPQAAGNVLLPHTGFQVGGSGRPIVGCPSVNMTNAECWAAHSVAHSGRPLPCSTLAAGINGFVCDSVQQIPRRFKPNGGGTGPVGSSGTTVSATSSGGGGTNGGSGTGGTAFSSTTSEQVSAGGTVRTGLGMLFAETCLALLSRAA